MFHVDTGADCQQLLRHLGEHPASVPVWRRQRPALMIEAASYRPATADEQVRGGGARPSGFIYCAMHFPTGPQLPILLTALESPFSPVQGSSEAGSSSQGTLLLTGHVRCAGLSANQLLHIPGAGDFQIQCIEAAAVAGPGPGSSAAAAGKAGSGAPHRGGGGGGGGAAADVDMDTSGSAPTLLAKV